MELFFAMLRTGVFGYGGGPSFIPLIRHEAVIRYRWLADEEFAEILAIANALPGPIATKMAAYLGARLKGLPGAVYAVLVHILPSGIAVIALLGVFHLFQHSPIVSGMIAAVDPVIMVMLGLMTYDFVKKTYKGLGKWFGTIFIVLAVLLLVIVDLQPAVVVITFLAYGGMHLRLVNRRRCPPKTDQGVST